jgi:hypothetical protein
MCSRRRTADLSRSAPTLLTATELGVWAEAVEPTEKIPRTDTKSPENLEQLDKGEIFPARPKHGGQDPRLQPQTLANGLLADAGSRNVLTKELTGPFELVPGLLCPLGRSRSGIECRHTGFSRLGSTQGADLAFLSRKIRLEDPPRSRHPKSL